MTTLLDLKMKIARDMQRSEAVSAIPDAINGAIRYYQREHFWFLEGRAFITSSASQAWYGVPSDFKTSEGILLTVNNSKTPLQHVTYAEIDTKDDGNTYGDPYEFAYFDDNFRFYPAFNAERIITLSYHKSLDAPESDSGSNAWTNTAFDLIRYRAERDIYATTLNDPNMAAVAASNEVETYNCMIRENNQRLSTGRVTKSYW